MQGFTVLWRGTWRDRVVLALAVVLFVAPTAILLLDDRPSRFGFQMYSGYGDVSASWEDETGAVHAVDLSDHLANERNEVDWTKTLPEDLCARIEGAVSVEVRRTQPGADARRSVRC